MAKESYFQIRISGPEGSRAERLTKSVHVMGRSPENDIIISHSEVSRRHLEIKVEGEDVRIKDLGSKNGSFLDGRRLIPQQAILWRKGQILKLGLAPEQIELEDTRLEGTAPDAPPPVDSISRKINFKKESPPRVELNLTAKLKSTETTAELPKPKAAEVSQAPIPKSEEDEESFWLGNKDASPVNESSNPSAPSLMKDLEARMNELMKQAEFDAKSILASNDPAKPQAQKEIKEVKLEKARVDSQLRELKVDVDARQDERKVVARDLADAKLRLQRVQEEKARLEAACLQLPAQIKSEIGELETKHIQLTEQVGKLDDEVHKKAAAEAKSLVDKARKQAEMIIAEGEMKAKAQRERLQIELGDERRALELDIADIKLKQMAEIKADREQFEKQWQGRAGESTANFMQVYREKMDALIANGDLDSGVALKLADEVEALARQILLQSASAKAADFGEDETVISVENVRVFERPRFPIKSVAYSGTAMILLALCTWKIIQSRSAQLEMTSVAAKPAAKVVAAAPQAAPVPVPVAPPPPPSADVVDEIQATTSVERQEVPVPQPAAPVVKSQLKSNRITWSLVLGNYRHGWMLESTKFLRTLRLDRAKLAKYAQLENKLAEGLSGRGRAVASEKERRKLEAQFARDASRLLGPKAWAKMLTFRDQFARKNR